MTAPASTPAPGAAPPMPTVPAEPDSAGLQRVVASLAELADDVSVPRNIRRGALSARAELEKPRVALDVRIAGAISLLDDLSNDPNLPTHGRTAIWSIVSSLESLP